MRIRKTILFLTVVAMAVALTAGTALAIPSHDQAGSGAAGKVDPHAGYSTTTDFCLQCHDIHDAEGDYALMRYSTVTATCRTCHGVYAISPNTIPTPTGAYDPGYSGTESTEAAPLIGFGSQQRVYEVPEGQKASHQGHRLGLRNGTDAATYTYGDGVTTDSASYIPGGGTGLTRIPSWSYWKLEFFDAGGSLAVDGQWDAANQNIPAGASATSSGGGIDSLGGLYCGSCHALHGDKNASGDGGGFGNALPSTVFDEAVDTTSYEYYETSGTGITFTRQMGEQNDKLLSAMPNHRGVADSATVLHPLDSATLTAEGKGVTSWYGGPTNGGFNYCAACHDERLQAVEQIGGYNVVIPNANGKHNHPSWMCLSCHANPLSDYGSNGINAYGDDTTVGNADANWDFPHTSPNANLLIGEPDAICLYCHPKGSLP